MFTQQKYCQRLVDCYCNHVNTLTLLSRTHAPQPPASSTLLSNSNIHFQPRQTGLILPPTPGGNYCQVFSSAWYWQTSMNSVFPLKDALLMNHREKGGVAVIRKLLEKVKVEHNCCDGVLGDL